MNMPRHELELAAAGFVGGILPFATFEFVMGAACLAAGLLVRVLSWFLRSRRAEALKHADEALAEDGWRGVTVLSTFRFGSALLMLIGAVLVSVSFIAYARF